MWIWLFAVTAEVETVTVALPVATVTSPDENVLQLPEEDAQRLIARVPVVS